MTTTERTRLRARTVLPLATATLFVFASCGGAGPRDDIRPVDEVRVVDPAADPSLPADELVPVNGNDAERGNIVRSSVGDLCLFSGHPNHIPELAFESRIQTGEPLMVEVTLPDCLSETCDVWREADCDVRRHGDEIVVDASFRYVEVDQEVCTMDCGRLTATCRTEPLAAGDYTVVYAGQTLALTVPSVTDSCPIQPQPCDVDQDCETGFCGTVDGESVCQELSEVGEPCAGLSSEQQLPVCAEGLTCFVEEAAPQLPGQCMAMRSASASRGS